MGVNIEINEDYKITSDARNFILNERYFSDNTKSPTFDPAKHEPRVTEKWRDIAYCSTISIALDIYVNRRIKTSDCSSITSLRALIDEVTEGIRGLGVDY